MRTKCTGTIHVPLAPDATTGGALVTGTPGPPGPDSAPGPAVFLAPGRAPPAPETGGREGAGCAATANALNQPNYLVYC